MSVLLAGRAAASWSAWTRGADRVAILLVALPVAAAAVLSRWLDVPILVAACAAALVVLVALGVFRFARAHGATAVWIAALPFSILAGHLSAISFGGQNGSVLWTDAVLGAGMVWLLLRNRLEIEVPRVPILITLVPLLAWSAVTLLVARDVLTGIAEFKEWVVATAVGAAAASFACDARRARLLLQIVAMTGALTALCMAYAAFHSPFGPVLAVLLKKVDLPWGRTNYLAGLLILALPIALGLMGGAATWRARVAWLAVLAANASGVVLSASKGAILALAAALLVAFARGGRSSRIGAVVMAGLIGLGVALCSVGPLRQVVRYRLQASALDYSVSERMDLYRLAWREFTGHPILGLGLNNFSVAANPLRGVDTVPHNLELGFLAELGGPGLVLVLAWVVVFGGAARRARVRAPTPGDRALAVGLWAAFLGFAIHNQFESTLYGEQYKILLMLVAVATWRLAEDWSHQAESAASVSGAGHGGPA
jgi:O-antigen ligase